MIWMILFWLIVGIVLIISELDIRLKEDYGAGVLWGPLCIGCSFIISCFSKNITLIVVLGVLLIAGIFIFRKGMKGN